MIPQGVCASAPLGGIIAALALSAQRILGACSHATCCPEPLGPDQRLPASRKYQIRTSLDHTVLEVVILNITI